MSYNMAAQIVFHCFELPRSSTGKLFYISCGFVTLHVIKHDWLYCVHLTMKWYKLHEEITQLPTQLLAG